MTADPARQPVGTADPIRVLVVDDHPAVRTALAARLSDEDDLTVVGECEDGSQVVEAATRLSPDVVFMDLAMPVMDGLAATGALRDGALGTRVIMLTADDAGARAGAAAAGARAVVPKGTPFPRLLDCLRTVTADGEGCPYCL
jgi:DNA-binding NarL/FixJ family response regulator